MWRPYVAANWQPYSNGRWVWSIFGWTWVPYESWGWAVSHYGRWGYGRPRLVLDPRRVLGAGLGVLGRRRRLRRLVSARVSRSSRARLRRVPRGGYGIPRGATTVAQTPWTYLRRGRHGRPRSQPPARPARRRLHPAGARPRSGAPDPRTGRGRSRRRGARRPAQRLQPARDGGHGSGDAWRSHDHHPDRAAARASGGRHETTPSWSRASVASSPAGVMSRFGGSLRGRSDSRSEPATARCAARLRSTAQRAAAGRSPGHRAPPEDATRGARARGSRSDADAIARTATSCGQRDRGLRGGRADDGGRAPAAPPRPARRAAWSGAAADRPRPRERAPRRRPRPRRSRARRRLATGANSRAPAAAHAQPPARVLSAPGSSAAPGAPGPAAPRSSSPAARGRPAPPAPGPVAPPSSLL